MKQPVLLGIDLGTSGVKVILVGLDGRPLATAGAGYPIYHPAPGHAEQRAQEWWLATVLAVREVLSDRVQDLAIAAIGLSGQMHGTVLLDGQGREICPAVIWPDQRSAAQVDEITRLIGAERLIEIAGSPVATGFQAATLRWFQSRAPHLLEKARHVLLPKDYLRLRLTDRFAVDPSDGSGTLLWDVHQRSWSSTLLDALGLDAGLFPSPIPSQAVAGALSEAAAAELGLPAGVPVVTGAADTACSALGAGAVESGTLLMTISTGGQLIMPLSEPKIDRLGRIHTFCSALEPTAAAPGWYQMGAILAAGMALRWLRDQIFGLNGEGAYAEMTTWAASVGPGADGLLFLPYLAGERTPHMDPHARGLFYGLTLQHGRAEMVRAVLEGVTLACYDAYQVLAEGSGSSQEIILAGGGARSGLWRQIVADVFGIPVRPLALAEQSAMGAALLAGAGSGQFDLLRTAREWAKTDAPIMPNPAHHALYAERYSLFQDAYRRTRDLGRSAEEKSAP